MPAVTVEGTIYVVGGFGASGPRSDIERIETQGGTLQVTDIPTNLKPRVYHTAEANGPYIYIFGGQIPGPEPDVAAPVSDSVERLDTRDMSVEAMAPLPIPLRVGASAIVDEKIYVVGGGSLEGQRVNNLLIYDIATNAWKEGAPMPEKKECDLIVWQGGLLALGGYDGTNTLAGVQSYDIATNTWSALPDLPVPTSAHHSCVVRDEGGQESVVIFGDYAQPNRVQRGDPRTGKWEILNNSPFKSARHAAVVPLKHKIFVIGGNVSSVGALLDDIQVMEDQDFLPNN